MDDSHDIDPAHYRSMALVIVLLIFLFEADRSIQRIAADYARDIGSPHSEPFRAAVEIKPQYLVVGSYFRYHQISPVSKPEAIWIDYWQPY